MAEKYKLTTNSSSSSQARSAKMMLSMAEHPFDEHTEDNLEDVPLGELPMLETAQGKLVHTSAINMFIAITHDFAPHTPFKQAQTCSILIAIDGLFDLLQQLQLEDVGSDKQKEIWNKYSQVLEFVEMTSQKGKRFIFGDQVTVADVVLFCLVESLKEVIDKAEVLTNWLKTFMVNMRSDSKVAVTL